MTAAKQKGTAWESLIVKALAAFFCGRFGLAPRRVAQEGFNDTGDIHGVSPFVIQAKAYRNIADGMRLGVAGAVLQAERAGEDFGVAVVKKPRGAVGDAYAVMRLQDWARLLLRLRRAESRLDAIGPHSGRVEFERDKATPFPREVDLR